jgi:hypothetical protein
MSFRLRDDQLINAHPVIGPPGIIVMRQRPGIPIFRAESLNPGTEAVDLGHKLLCFPHKLLCFPRKALCLVTKLLSF